MTSEALRSASKKLISAAAAAVSALLLASCGGSGGGSTTEGNFFTFLPLGTQVTAYAGVPTTIYITGGRRPYTLASSDQALFPVPGSPFDNDNFTVVPNNPGVIDADVTENEVPRRTLMLSARETNGTFAQQEVRVYQNFLTGYGTFFQSTCPAAGGATGTVPQACPGRESIITANPVSQGTRYGNRAMRFTVVRGAFQFVVAETPSNTPRVLANEYTTSTDHTGLALARIYVQPGAGTQLATFRLTDVISGMYTDTVFTIVAGGGTIVAIPDTLTFTGALTGSCGTGSSQVFLFDGIPPYTATSTSPNLIIVPIAPNANPGVFTVAATNDQACGSFPVIFQDATGARVTVTVTTAGGTGTLPALAVAPTTHTLGCGASGSSTVIGGSGSYSANSSDPARVTATVAGGTITFTRVGPVGPGTGSSTIPVVVSDGATLITVNVTTPATCP